VFEFLSGTTFKKIRVIATSFPTTTFQSHPHDKKVIMLQVRSCLRLLSYSPVWAKSREDIQVACFGGAFSCLITQTQLHWRFRSKEINWHVCCFYDDKVKESVSFFEQQ